MNKLNEVLKEIAKEYPKYKWVAIDEDLEAFVLLCKPVIHEGSRCFNNKGNHSFKLNSKCTIELLRAVDTTDWKEMCWELPITEEWGSDVKNMYTCHNGHDICTTYKDKATRDKCLKKLKAQQKIYDIIAKTQYELDPDWIADWSDVHQWKTWIFYNYHRKELKNDSLSCYQYLDNKLYMSKKVARYILDNKLITKELWLEAFA